MDNENPFENLFFKCCVEPRHLNSPFTMIASRVQSASHSSMLCDVSTIDFPELRTFDTMFHRLRFAPGSIPVVGSSVVENRIVYDHFSNKPHLLTHPNKQRMGCQSKQPLCSTFACSHRNIRTLFCRYVS